MIRALLLAFVIGASAVAQADVPVPPLTGRVVDQTATLTRDQQQGLERTLAAFEQEKGSQIAVLIVPTTRPEAIEQYSIRVAEQWKLGRTRVDDGAILLVAKDDRAVRIEVGYGLEGALNDATCNRIIEEVIVPRFRNGDFYGGISAGVERMMGVIRGEPLPPPDRRSAGGGPSIQQYGPMIFVLALIVGSVLRAVLGRLPGAVVAGGVVGLIAWWFTGFLIMAIGAAALAFFFTLAGGMGGGWGGGGRYPGGFGSGSSDGFGDGFRGGGGRFGGGGASGRW